MFSIGKIVRPHGLKGAVKIVLFYNYSYEILKKNKGIINETAVELEEIFANVDDKYTRIKIKNCNSIEETEKFINQYVDYEPENEEFYTAQLIGLNVLKKGKNFGIVSSVQNFGAQDLLVINEEYYSYFDFDISSYSKGFISFL